MIFIALAETVPVAISQRADRGCVSLQRAKSGLGEQAGGSLEGKGGKAHSILSSHLQSGGRKNSITGVTKRHLSRPLCSSMHHSCPTSGSFPDFCSCFL